MKRLVLVRHAKSSWDAPALDDAARPLNPRGLRDAPVMGRRIAAGGARPELIICSPAIRAKTTAALLARELDYAEADIRIENNLYCFDAGGLLEAIRRFDNSLQQILCVGHNPAITELVNRLCDVRIDNVPTCGVCSLQFETNDWDDISTAVLTAFDYPKKTA